MRRLCALCSFHWTLIVVVNPLARFVEIEGGADHCDVLYLDSMKDSGLSLDR